MGALDPLYEFTQNRSFNDYLKTFLEDATRPLLEYAALLYRLPKYVPGVFTPETYRLLRTKTTEHQLRSSYLGKILTSLLGKSPWDGKLYETTVKFKVPTDANHNFWLKVGLEKVAERYEPSIEVEVSAFS